jgi:hypothetical protein
MHLDPVSWLRRLAFTIAVAVPALALAQSGGSAFSSQQLDQLTAQIALYPDSLLSQVLMAATYPADVAEAAKWSRANSEMKGDDAVKMVENQPWDPSVQSLVAFPQVIIMMGEKPEWVRDLGDAFLDQPEDVMDSVQRLRARAQQAGNLQSNDQVKVTFEDPPPPTTTTVVTQAAPQQIIVIQPAQPEIVFVPQYNPTVVFGAWPYPAYPPFFTPWPPGFWFSSAVMTGVAWGVGIGVRNALWGGVNWGWGRSSVNINVNRYNNINVNRRLDVNGGSTRWNHNVQNRRDVPYRGGNATRDRLERRQQAGSREQYRGRDESRQRAAQSMQNRGINVDQAALRDRAQNVDRSAVQNRAQNVDRSAVQNRAQNVDRGALQDRAQNVDRSAVQNRAQNVDRSALQDRAQNVDRSAVQNRAQNVDRSAAQNRAQNVDRSAVQNRAQNVDRDALRNQAQSADRSAMQNRTQSMNRDNALRGAGDRNAQQQIDRGNASRQAMQQRPQPHQQRAQPQQQRQPPQRPAGGGGAARGGGGGGGGGGAARGGGGRGR